VPFAIFPLQTLGRWSALFALVGLVLLTAPASLEAQLTPLRLRPSETLSYSGDFGVFGKVGTGVLSVSAPVCHQGRPALRLDFTFEGRVMRMNVRDHTRSWVELATGTTLEYRKEERQPMGTRTERVRIYPEQGWWEPAGGVVQALPAPDPLDELSFLFLARTLTLGVGEMQEFNRHFDPARNPVRIRDRGMERVRVPAGEFMARVVEMEVRDDSRFGGNGRIILHLSNDATRIPVRIATAMPVVGALVLVLEDRTVDPAAAAAAHRNPC
jgi:hypothetical protein